MFRAIRKFLVQFSSTVADSSPTGTLRPFDLVVKFTDGEDEVNRSFASTEEREAHVQNLVQSPKSAVIESIAYERSLVFWQSSDSSAMPESAPDLDGEGELVLRICFANNTTLEASGYSLSKIISAFEKPSGISLRSPQLAMVLRRITVYQRMSVLVRADSIPVSAARDDE